ncbi:hypothetical protein BJV78DRAFT_418061 [Lactifluus subvellereus]|nr:hypothetical protein BJV78DRAFT_418061 [Lactifluus subvellereus]
MRVRHAAEERFDPLSFKRYFRNIGRAYQRQAIELVNICRFFVEASSQELQHDATFNEMMLAADKALQSATEAGRQETGKASNAFEEAKNKLLDYRERVHPGTCRSPRKWHRQTGKTNDL